MNTDLTLKAANRALTNAIEALHELGGPPSGLLEADALAEYINLRETVRLFNELTQQEDDLYYS